ncbi:DUF397 domain-containing protein [Streptomyces rubradiris]|uniref:DUF397 domain-containing protein n=1 Tax=Streptomyces rubradiris TaxID=285531 RepID=A0ABQ3RDD6_STRRR|nr:DUF397 domain-containing protein [Streptomyces rubradiris]GHG95342.1 hypothetical protein GCM10018792_06060 [Streptomyces rubradiris]GHI53869.1 hypothetical protein Srubr_37150 [Streptomyces rubradiris]
MHTRADDLQVNWFRSSYSNDQGGACVEGGRMPNGSMAVRDSKIPHGAAFVVPADSWAQFIASVNNGHFSA